MHQHTGRRGPPPARPDSEPSAGHEHLLRVADSVNRDAAQVWSKLWDQLKAHVTAQGVVQPGRADGFVPACGWSEFVEQMWLLKHYLDSTHRICRSK